MRAGRDDLPTRMEGPGWWSKESDWGPMHVSWQHAEVDVDTTETFRALPSGACPCEHWGYVTAGSITFRFGADEMIVRSGDAYHAPPGHVCLVAAGTELIEFTDARSYADLVDALGIEATA